MAPTSSAQLSNFTEVNFGTNFNENDCSAIIPATVEANASFSLVEGASNKGGVLLMDPNNYCYTKNIDKRRKYTDWTCRNARKYKCKAGYRALENGSYILLHVSRTSHPHICEANNFAKEAPLRRNLKRKGKDNIHMSALEVIKDILVKYPECTYSMPKRTNLIRAINHFRQVDRPVNPADLEFSL